jgi:hypothetical protein
VEQAGGSIAKVIPKGRGITKASCELAGFRKEFLWVSAITPYLSCSFSTPSIGYHGF